MKIHKYRFKIISLIILIFSLNLVTINVSASDPKPFTVSISQNSSLTLTKIYEAVNKTSMGTYFAIVPNDTQTLNIQLSDQLSSHSHFFALRGAKKQIFGSNRKINGRICNEEFIEYNEISSRKLPLYITNCYNDEKSLYTISLLYNPGFFINSETINEQYPDIIYDSSLTYQEICIYEYKTSRDLILKAVLFVQIGESNVEEIDTSLLIANINEAKFLSQETYYTNNDRYNGKDYDTLSSSDKTFGFFKDVQLELNLAKELFINNNIENDLKVGITQDIVDEKALKLGKKIGKLIPKTLVNATLLYETIIETEQSLNDSSIYTADSWSTYQTELTKAKAILSSLYVQEGENKGKPTEINKSGYQSDVDTVTESLKQAVLGLEKTIISHDPLGKDLIDAKERYENLEALVNIHFTPDKLVEADYVEANWATFIDTRNKVVKWLNDHNKPQDTTGISVYHELKEVYDALWLSCYGLTSIKDDMHVSLKVIDTHAARKSTEHDAKSGTYDLSLSAGATLGDAFNQIGGINIHGDYGIFINDVLLITPSCSLSSTKFTLNLGHGIGELYSFNSIKLKDDDKVVVAYIETPVQQTSSGHAYEGYNPYQVLSYLKVAKLTSPSMTNQVMETIAGKPFTCTAKATYGNISDYTGTYTPFTGATLFISPVAQTREQLMPASEKTTVITDKNGQFSYTFYQEGWYALSVHHLEGNDFNSGKLSGLIAGDTVLVHVNTATEDEVLVIKNDLLAKLDTDYHAYNENDYTPDHWQALTSYYNHGKTDISKAMTPYEAKTALDIAVQGMKNIEYIDHAGVITALRELLLYLPTPQELELNRLFKSDRQKLQELSSQYIAMSDYQKGLLTGLELNHIKAMLKLYADSNNGENLPEDEQYKVVIVDKTNRFKGADSFIRCMVNDNIISSTNPEVVMGHVAPNTVVSMWYSGNIKEDSTCVVESLSDDIHIYNMKSDLPTLMGDFVMPHHDVTITIQSIGGDPQPIDPAEALANAKTSARNAVLATYNTYDSSAYSEENWSKLTAAKNNGLAAIDQATDVDDVAQARRTALAAMAAVPEDTGNEPVNLPDYGSVVGKVKITMENTTFHGGDFTGTILSGWYDLCERDTMMTSVLKALATNGYTWEGTGGSLYDITYLAIISKGDKKMGEFSGDQGSGWMGTLNDWFVNEGFQSFKAGASNKDYSLENGDEIRIMYTQNLGKDLGGTWASADTALQALTISGGQLMPAFHKNTREYALLIEGNSKNIEIIPTAVNKNYLVKTFLNQYNTSSAYYKRTETLSVGNGDIVYIGIGEKAWPSMNNQGDEIIAYNPTKYTIKVYSNRADYVNKLMAALPSKHKINAANYLDYKGDIAAARSQYNALSADEKKNITYLDRLIGAEDQIIFYTEIDQVKTLLKAIPLASKVNLSHKAAVLKADTAYKALSTEQQLYITVGDVANYNAAIQRLIELGAFDDHNSPTVIVGNDEEPESFNKETFVTIKPQVKVSGKTVTSTLTTSQGKKAIEDIKKNKAKALFIEPAMDEDVNKVVVKLPKSFLQELAKETEANVIAKSHVAEISLSTEVMKAIAANSGADVSITAEHANKQALSDKHKKLIGEKPVYHLTITVDDQEITDFEGKIEVALPYLAGDSEVIENLGVYWINDGGTAVKMQGAYYDDQRECMIFETDHFSTFAIVYGQDNVTFQDVKPTDWFYPAVTFVADHGLFDGMTDTHFRPYEKMTRAMLVKVLFHMAGDPKVNHISPFNDITEDSMYADALSWGSYSKIVSGYTDGSFGPDDYITREQIATMLYRYAKLNGYSVTVTADLTTYADDGQISEWATRSMKWAASHHLISGVNDDTLSPQSPATRGEVATMLMRFMTDIVK